MGLNFELNYENLAYNSECLFLIGLMNEKIKGNKLGIMELGILAHLVFWHWVFCHATAS